jgi:hypothetical protein
LKVEVMAKVNPHENKECKIWPNERVVEIVQGFRGLLMVS